MPVPDNLVEVMPTCLLSGVVARVLSLSIGEETDFLRTHHGQCYRTDMSAAAQKSSTTKLNI